MSIGLIDDALHAKIANWVKDPNLRILKPNDTAELFRVRGDTNNDMPISLPLVALSRDTDFEILQVQKKPLSFSGKVVGATNKDVMLLNAIPITVYYQLDIYTKFRDEGDEYMRNFIFNFINHPKFVVTIPYQNIDLKHNANIRLEPTVGDTSDIPQRLFPGQFTRWTLKLTVDDCYLFSVPINEAPQIVEADLEVVTNKVVVEIEPIDIGER